MLRAAVLGLSLALAIATSAAAAPAVFHSPNDDGLPGVQTPSLTPGAHTLHLYIEGGATESSADPCFEGDGSELENGTCTCQKMNAPSSHRHARVEASSGGEPSDDALGSTATPGFDER